MRTTGSSRRGPSPCVRGSRARSAVKWAMLGSIPACAGEPARPPHRAGPARVHPRVCGGARATTVRAVVVDGPSPRVRGSHRRARRRALDARSIPACAGEPYYIRPRFALYTVHPRVCGGAVDTYNGCFPGYGPSPRVRGSHNALRCPSAKHGSIPACAGEPPPPRRPRCPGTVHPRVCGGARPRFECGTRTRGPSPRVRGSRWPPILETSLLGSIPACAGEPLSLSCSALSLSVHPRVCGGAARYERF